MPTSSRQTARKAVSARTFADTGGWTALLSRDDAHHAQAAGAWPGILRRFHRVATTNLVIAESYTFLRRRVGFAAAWTLLDRLQATPRLELVYADAVSFTAMKRESVTHAFGFDQHFLTAGFELIPSGRSPG